MMMNEDDRSFKVLFVGFFFVYLLVAQLVAVVIAV
jgi:hypothetical protein